MYAKCLDGRGWRKSIFASLKLKPVGRVIVVLDRSHSTQPRVVYAQILRELRVVQKEFTNLLPKGSAWPNRGSTAHRSRVRIQVRGQPPVPYITHFDTTENILNIDTARGTGGLRNSTH